MSIQAGENPKFLRERLLTYMEQMQRELASGESSEGGKNPERKPKSQISDDRWGEREGSLEKSKGKKESGRRSQLDGYLWRYGDAPALLFVLLYSMSTISEENWKALVMSFNPLATETHDRHPGETGPTQTPTTGRARGTNYISFNQVVFFDGDSPVFEGGGKTDLGYSQRDAQQCGGVH